MKVKIYVEGGAYKSLDQECRKAFHDFFVSAGFKRPKLPTVIPSHGRTTAIKNFITAIKNSKTDEISILLVHSEEKLDPSTQPSGEEAIKHLERRDIKNGFPATVDASHVHLMVVTMESWFLADPRALKNKFPRLDLTKFPENSSIETLSKDAVNQKLNAAMKNAEAGSYDKGDHSFELLGRLDAQKVPKASPWAARFLNDLRDLLK